MALSHTELREISKTRYLLNGGGNKDTIAAGNVENLMLSIINVTQSFT
jgi:hypothetical protein